MSAAESIEAAVEVGAPEPVTKVVTPVRLEYVYPAGIANTRGLLALQEGRFIGEEYPDGKVYVPCRGYSPTSGEAAVGNVELSDKGTVTTFCVVNVPFYGQEMEIPYVCATVLLDGADIGLFHILQEVNPAEVRMGMRVEAVWSDPADRRPAYETIKYFRPTGEPDASRESYQEHV
jgi:uncharacterized OB-fold protein